ncbi:response regulator transcription factor [Ramlibacter sp. AN1015]|uniref:response regulator transcription factor n=1 Tax=Ramlibacter sp. AN1015 TaxID=3133428 RepID=UPI0030C149BB
MTPLPFREPGRPVRVIVIDDDPDIRARVVKELEADPRMHLVAHGGSVRSGKRLIATRTFDVMLVDLNLGDGSGFELIEYMKCTRDHAEAIVISVMDDEQRALRAFELGAAGYLTKNTAFGQFATAVLQVWNGGASITPTLARRMLQRLRPAAAPAPAPGWAAQMTQDEDVPLSAREIEVLKLIAIGYTNPEIAQRLGLSVQTVHTHVRNVYTKLHVNSRAQAVSKATRRRLI